MIIAINLYLPLETIAYQMEEKHVLRSLLFQIVSIKTQNLRLNSLLKAKTALVYVISTIKVSVTSTGIMPKIKYSCDLPLTQAMKNAVIPQHNKAPSFRWSF